jgi:BirA family biotin operon repressor/biotin-[acetyl-CoA-carboxylase] ligase
MSIILKPEIDPGDATLITIVTAVACAISLKKVTGMRVSIKWPNDLIVSGKKIGGILTELKTYRKKILYAIVGIGINVNVNSEDRKSTRLNSSHNSESRMPSSA